MAEMKMGMPQDRNRPDALNDQRVKSIEINDHVLADNKSLGQSPPRSSRFEVEEVDGKYQVVVKAWSEPQKSMVTGGIVKLDSNNQFQPEGMRWQFTLTPDGYLTWKEIPKE